MQYAFNKKATFNYEVLEKFESGISLLGFEVKSVKNNRANLEGSYIIIRGGEVFLVNADIPPYQIKNTPETYDQHQPRKLLLTKKEIKKLNDSLNQKGLTLIPVSLYNKGRNIKLEFALAKGKKKFDKRETIKKRESDRDIQRTLKGKR